MSILQARDWWVSKKNGEEYDKVGSFFWLFFSPFYLLLFLLVPFRLLLFVVYSHLTASLLGYGSCGCVRVGLHVYCQH